MTKANELYGRPWNEKEYIVVLDYYYKYKDQPRHTSKHYIQELAKLLGRTPASIVMRMENFASLDPDVNSKRKGLINVNPFCCRMFNNWSSQIDSLKACSEAFMRDIKAADTTTLFEPEPIQMPKAFGKYELFDQIGQGAFGYVFSCIDTETDKPFAIKFIRTDIAHSEEHYHRFLREIKALKSISHSNVIKIHEDNLDTEKNYPAFVMDLAAGNLNDYLSEKQKLGSGMRPFLNLQERNDILRSIFDGVQALHTGNSPIIHRDINPYNILQTTDGHWILADFSLSKFLAPAPTSVGFSTGSQQRWGTEPYTAPEQWRDFKNADERADIYAIARIMWDLFSCLPPPPRPEEDLHGLPDELAPIYHKASAYDADKRYETVEQLRSDFEEAIDSLEDNSD
jgi:serine/threonine protein kinase